MTHYLACAECGGEGVVHTGGNNPYPAAPDICPHCRGTGEARCDECHGPATTLHAEDGREYALCDACATVWRAPEDHGAEAEWHP